MAKLANFESLERREMLTATPAGDGFLVSLEFQPSQRIIPAASSIAFADSGESIVVYQGQGVSGSRLPGDDREIFIQRYDADGNESGDPLVANAVSRGDQFDPSTDAAADGTFWVTWSGRGSGDRHGIFAQRFAADGSTIGNTLLVNSTVGGAQRRPDIAAADDGSAVIVWSGVGTTTGNRDFDGIFMRRIDATGGLVGEETLVNSTTDGHQGHPAVAMSDSGEFVIAWQSRHEDGDAWGVFAQQFNADGTTKGTQLAVNSTTAGSQAGPDVGVASDDSFVVSFSSFAQDGDGWGVFAHQFTSGGARVGGELQVNSSTAGHQLDSAISVAERGEFLVVWSHGEPGGSGWEIDGRSYNQEGDPGEEPFSVNMGSTGLGSGHQRFPSVDMNATGQALVVYQGNGIADHHGVFGQRYDVEVGPTENVMPQITSINGETILMDITVDGIVGQQLTIPIVAEDPNRDDILTFSLDPTQSPDDAVINPIDNNNAEVLWTPSIEDLGNTNVTIRVLVEDNGQPEMLGDAQAFFVSVQNQAPVLDLNGSNDTGTGFQTSLEQVETSVAAVDTDLTITDTEQTTLTGATAALTGVTDPAFESLIVDVTGTNITAEYDAQLSRLTLSGEDSIENYQNVLRTLTYENTATGRAFEALREIDITVNDGETESNEATAQITVVGDNATPELMAISDVTLLAGSPLHIPLVASDADGQALSFNVTSDNAIVSTSMPMGNRSARITVSSPTDPSFVGGEMVFQLFEQRAERATEQIIALAEDGFYDDIIFHRVIDGFVIQGGDPTGTGSGGSDLGDFDDQFHPDLQHNRTGVLSMAKSLDDTNDSQFFVTEGPTRSLDSNHTIFGQLITGDEVREEISNVATTGANGRPVNNVVIDSFEIFVDEQNGLLMLSAPEGTASGSATITVTVSDGAGGSAIRTFNVDVMPDPDDNQPFLEDIPQLAMATNSTETFQLGAVEIDGDTVIFLDQDELSQRELLQPLVSPDLTYSVDPGTGELTVVASNNVIGTFQFTVGVIQEDPLILQGIRAIDLQVVEIVVGRVSPT